MGPRNARRRPRPGSGAEVLAGRSGGQFKGTPPADVIDISVALSRTRRGCTCTPDVVVTGVTVNGIRHIHVAHDDNCPALAGDTR